MPSKPMFTNDLFTLSAPASAVAPSLPILLSAKRAMFSSLAHRSDAARTSQIQFRQRRVALERDGQRLGAVVAKTIHCSRTAVSVASRSKNSTAKRRACRSSRHSPAPCGAAAHRSDADQANVVACTGNSIATNEHARAAPRRTDQRDARHRLVALQPVGQRHTWPSSPS